MAEIDVYWANQNIVIINSLAKQPLIKLIISNLQINKTASIIHCKLQAYRALTHHSLQLCKVLIGSVYFPLEAFQNGHHSEELQTSKAE